MPPPAHSDPRLYLAPSASDLYAPVPVYYDPNVKGLVPVGYKAGDAFIEGCTCAERGTKCQPHPLCRCEEQITPEDGGACDSSRCKACKKDRSGCIVRPGCECRRNAGLGHDFVCNELCHGRRRQCANKYTVTPREDSIKIVEVPGMGFGVRASKRIPAGTCLGIYSGVLMTGLELLAKARAVEIATEHSLGIAAYLDRSLLRLGMTTPGNTDDASTADALSVTSAHDEDEFPVDCVVAAHVLQDNEKHVLVVWEDHSVPTWIPDNPDLTHALECTDLRSDLADDTADFQKDVGPEAYIMCAGHVNKVACCADCTQENNEGRDARVYVDASGPANFCRNMNHSCDPNVAVFPARLGSSFKSLPMPVLRTNRTVRPGQVLSIAYWDVRRLTTSQRQKLRNQRKDDRHNYNDCRCGSTQCTGWITIPPRNALRAAGVPEATIADLWDDEFVDETLLS